VDGSGHRPGLVLSCDDSSNRQEFVDASPRINSGTQMAREGIPLPVIQRQLGHAHLGVTSTDLQGIDTTEIINTVHARTAPVIPASAGLAL
jgi:hypothetical protein